MRTLGNCLFFAAAVPLVAYPVAYHVTTHGDWRRTLMGRLLMSFMAVLALVMVFAVLAMAWHPLPLWVRPVVWALVAGVSWWMLTMLFVRRYRDEEGPRPT